MFEADPTLQDQFLIDEHPHYCRVAQLIPLDEPLIMIAPAFMSTERATNALADILPILSNDQMDRFKQMRYDAYIRTCWVDTPHVVVTMITGHSYKPVTEYRMQTHAHRLFLTLMGKLDMPMIAHCPCPDYDQLLHWNSQVQPGERVQLHQVLNHRPKLRHMLQINNLQIDAENPRYE